jgi:hypothetical protein
LGLGSAHAYLSLFAQEIWSPHQGLAG